jgi:hypothetical protein
MTATKFGMGKIQLPNDMTDTQRGRMSESQRSRLSDTHRGSSPSLHDSHDEVWPPANEIDVVMLRLKILEARVESVEQKQTESTPPGAVELKSPGGWSGRAPRGVAVLLALIAALTFLRGEIGKLIAIVWGGK